MKHQHQEMLDNWLPFVNECKVAPSPNVNAAKLRVAMIAQQKQSSFVMESFATPDNIGGVGIVSLPAVSATQNGFDSAAAGSIDAISNLGLTMSIAAHTVGFDVVPFVPVASELIVLDYVDAVYAGGRTNSTAKPSIFTINSPVLAALSLTPGQDILIAGVDGAPAMKVKFVQKHRTKADKIIVTYVSSGAFTLAGAAYTVNETLTLDAISAASTRYSLNNGAAVVALAPAITIELTSSNYNHTALGSNNLNFDMEPMSRDTQETSNDTVTLEFKTYKKAVQCKTFTTNGIISRQQARVFRAKGLEGVPMLRNAVQTQVTQSINDNILNRMRALGVSNHYDLFKAQGINFNLFVGPAGTATKAFNTFGVPAFKDMKGVDVTSSFGAIANAETNSAAENLYSRQARVRSRVLAAAGVIGSVSRHGAADAVIVGPQLFAVLKESAGFKACTVDNTIVQSVKNLYYAGDMADVKIFCNPKLSYNDTTVIVARTNKSGDGIDYENLTEGIVFCAHDLAATVELIAESTASPKIVVDSVYALAEVGIFPELCYLTFAVCTDFNNALWV